MAKQLKGVILAILLVTGCAGLQDRPAARETPTRGANIVIAQASPLSVRSFEQRATEVARQWRPDAYLVGANVVIPVSGPDGTLTVRATVSFDFLSKADEEHWYTVSVDPKGTMNGFEFSSRMTEGDVRPIESSDWPLDSTDAWRVAQSNGGAALLHEYQEQAAETRCYAMLQRWSPSYTGRVIWNVGCIDAVAPKSFDFQIDAQTGEVLQKQAR